MPNTYRTIDDGSGPGGGSSAPPPAETRVDRYLRWTGSAARWPAALRLVGHGVWLGLLDDDDLDQLDVRCYDHWRQYRDRAHNLSGLATWEAAAMDRHFPPSGRLLVVAAGGGREVLALARRGFRVDGCECHPGLLEVARNLAAEQGAEVGLLASPRDGLAAPASAYAGAVVGWGAFSLVRTRRRRIELLRRLADLLAPGAPVLLSFFLRSRRGLGWRAVFIVACGLRRLRRRPAPAPGDGLAPNFVHCFHRAELVDELAAGGFRLVDWRTEPYPHAVGRRQPD